MKTVPSDCSHTVGSHCAQLRPGWMVPAYSRTTLHLVNIYNGSRIDGESANKSEYPVRLIATGIYWGIRDFVGMLELYRGGHRVALEIEGDSFRAIHPGGTGKVQVTVQGRFMTLDAVCEDKEMEPWWPMGLTLDDGFYNDGYLETFTRVSDTFCRMTNHGDGIHLYAQMYSTPSIVTNSRSRVVLSSSWAMIQSPPSIEVIS